MLVLLAVFAAGPIVGPEGNTDYRAAAVVPQVPVDSPPGWSDDTLLSINDVQESRVPEMVMDGLGRLHAVWKDNRRLNGRDEVHYRCKDSTGWSGLFSVGNLDTVHNSPDVCVDPGNSAHVVFLRWYGVPYAYYDVGYRRRDGTTGNWDPEERLTVDDSLGFSTYPQTVFAVDSVFVFWQNERSSPPEIWYVYNDGTGWSEQHAIVTGDARPGGYYDVLATGDDWIHIVWQDYRTGTTDLWHRYHNGDSWSVPEQVTDHGYNSIQPSIAVDSAGDIHLAYSGGGPDVRIHYRIRDRSTGVWGPVTHFYSWAGTPFPKVGVNLETGERHLTHVGHSGGCFLCYRRYDPVAQVWTDSTQLTFYDVATGPAKPVLDADGYVHLVFWDQRFGAQEEIFYKTNRIVTGIGEAGVEGSRAGMLVFPSVTSGRVHLTGSGSATLFDIRGRRVAGLGSGANDLRHVPAGVYFVRGPAGNVAQKLVIQSP
jgi:hypothetical protein